MDTAIAQRMQGISPFYVMELLQRAKQLEQQGRDVIHLEIGEPDFKTPEVISRAGMDFIASGQIKYTSAAGLPELRQAIADYYQHKYAVKVDEKQVFITPGASGAFLLALGASLDPGQEVLMSDPSYPCNDNFIRLFSGISRMIPVGAENRYQLTADLVAQHWNQQSKGVIIASPANPTGTIIPNTELKAVVNQVLSKGGCFYSDEIYHGLVYDDHESTALEFSDQVFVINSFSKFFGMTGWRIGWLIVPEAFVDAVEKLAQNIFISAPTHSQYAALAAFTTPTLQVLEQRRLEFLQRRDFLHQSLLDLGFKVAVKPQGAFYIYADCSLFSDDSFVFAKQLLESEAVAITPGKDFGNHAEEKHVRFAYTTSMPGIQRGIQRIRKFLRF